MLLELFNSSWHNYPSTFRRCTPLLKGIPFATKPDVCIQTLYTHMHCIWLCKESEPFEMYTHVINKPQTYSLRYIATHAGALEATFGRYVLLVSGFALQLCTSTSRTLTMYILQTV